MPQVRRSRPFVKRLKTRAQFQATMSGGTVARTPHFALHRLPLATAGTATSTGPESEGPQALFAVQELWMGALVPKRWARRAVTRNAIRRQIYAVSAVFEPTLPRASFVVRLRAAFDRSQFPSATSLPLKRAVRGELEQLFGKATA